MLKISSQDEGLWSTYLTAFSNILIGMKIAYRRYGTVSTSLNNQLFYNL